MSHNLPLNRIIHHQDKVTVVALSVEILITLLEIVPEEGVIKTMMTGGMMSDSITEVNWRSPPGYRQDMYDERLYHKNENPNWRSSPGYRQGRSSY